MQRVSSLAVLDCSESLFELRVVEQFEEMNIVFLELAYNGIE